MRWVLVILAVLLVTVGGLAYYLLRPLRHPPTPASFSCLDLAQGSYVPLGPPSTIYGVGFAYAGHIHETAADFEPGAPPPIFGKAPQALTTDGSEVALPDSEAIFAAADSIELRQRQNTSDLIYTPREMLRFIHAKYPAEPLHRGDMVLTGTAGGVAMATPRWIMRLANLIGFDRFKKLEVSLGKDQSRFLKAGDEVIVRGQGMEAQRSRSPSRPPSKRHTHALRQCVRGRGDRMSNLFN